MLLFLQIVMVVLGRMQEQDMSLIDLQKEMDFMEKYIFIH